MAAAIPILRYNEVPCRRPRSLTVDKVVVRSVPAALQVVSRRFNSDAAENTARAPMTMVLMMAPPAPGASEPRGSDSTDPDSGISPT